MLIALICGFCRSLAGQTSTHKLQPVQSSGATCSTYFWPRISRTSRPANADWLARSPSPAGNDFCTNRRVRAGGDAVITLCTQFLFPDRNLFGDIAFFPAGGAHRPCSVRRQGGNRQCVAKARQHGGGNGFHEIRRGVGDDRRAMRAVRINRLQRHFRQRFLRQSQCLPVTLNQILTFAAIALAIAPCSSTRALSPGRICVRWKKAICMTVLMRAPSPHSRAIFAALTT